MLVVVALGGNALLKRGESMNVEVQQQNAEVAARQIADLAREHDVVVTHGNGPQVGLLALQAAAYTSVEPHPLDVLGAESEGMIGYLVEKELRNRLPGRDVVTLLTQTLVDPSDPAFDHPTKYVGPVYSKTEAEALAEKRGWTIAADGEYYRRVVPSPKPRTILEAPVIRKLVADCTVVVCTGGGGIPVACDDKGQVHGIEAVIDKDRASALLASYLDADALLMLTDVDAVYEDWGTPRAQAIDRATPAMLHKMDFATGSMGPKIEAACDFVNNTGGIAAIGTLSEATAVLRGEAGTLIHPGKIQPALRPRTPGRAVA